MERFFEELLDQKYLFAEFLTVPDAGLWFIPQAEYRFRFFPRTFSSA